MCSSDLELVACAYPERVALARGGGSGRFLTRGGRGAELPPGDPLLGCEVLAIAAAVRGGGVADAIEIDPSVHQAIRANAARNGVASRLTVAADLPCGSGGYDLVVANIVADVLLQHADALCERARKDTVGTRAGGVILSGLVAADVATVEAAYAGRLGTAPVTTRLGDWHCLRFGNPAG